MNDLTSPFLQLYLTTQPLDSLRRIKIQEVYHDDAISKHGLSVRPYAGEWSTNVHPHHTRTLTSCLYPATVDS